MSFQKNCLSIFLFSTVMYACSGANTGYTHQKQEKEKREAAPDFQSEDYSVSSTPGTFPCDTNYHREVLNKPLENGWHIYIEAITVTDTSEESLKDELMDQFNCYLVKGKDSVKITYDKSEFKADNQGELLFTEVQLVSFNPKRQRAILRASTCSCSHCDAPGANWYPVFDFTGKKLAMHESYGYNGNELMVRDTLLKTINGIYDYEEVLFHDEKALFVEPFGKTSVITADWSKYNNAGVYDFVKQEYALTFTFNGIEDGPFTPDLWMGEVKNPHEYIFMNTDSTLLIVDTTLNICKTNLHKLPQAKFLRHMSNTTLIGGFVSDFRWCIKVDEKGMPVARMRVRD